MRGLPLTFVTFEKSTLFFFFFFLFLLLLLLLLLLTDIYIKLRSELATEELNKRWDRTVLLEQVKYDDHVENVRRSGGDATTMESSRSEL